MILYLLLLQEATKNKKSNKKKIQSKLSAALGYALPIATIGAIAGGKIYSDYLKTKQLNEEQLYPFSQQEFKSLLKKYYRLSKDFKNYIDTVHNGSIDNIVNNTDAYSKLNDHCIGIYYHGNGDIDILDLKSGKVYTYIHDLNTNKGIKPSKCNIDNSYGRIVHWSGAYRQ